MGRGTTDERERGKNQHKDFHGRKVAWSSRLPIHALFDARESGPGLRLPEELRRTFPQPLSPSFPKTQVSCAVSMKDRSRRPAREMQVAKASLHRNEWREVGAK